MFQIINYQDYDLNRKIKNEYIRLKNILPQFLHKSEQALILCDQIRNKVGIDKINYKENAIEFNQAYYFKNLLKCLAVLSFLQEASYLNYKTIIDLGCGAGTFSNAYSKYFNFEQAILIDKSSEQIQLADKLNQKNNITFINADLNSIKVKEKALILCSYLFCEGIAQQINFCNDMLIIDYLSAIKKFINLNRLKYSFSVFVLRLKLSDFCYELLRENDLDVYFCFARKK